MEPFAPKICTVLSRDSDTAVATRAMRPLGKRSSAAAHWSTPVSAKAAKPATSSGSSPATRRAMDTG